MIAQTFPSETSTTTETESELTMTEFATSAADPITEERFNNRTLSYRWLIGTQEPSEYSGVIDPVEVYAELSTYHYAANYRGPARYITRINFVRIEKHSDGVEIASVRPFDAALVCSEECKRYSEKRLRAIAAEALEAVAANRLCLEFFNAENAPHG